MLRKAEGSGINFEAILQAAWWGFFTKDLKRNAGKKGSGRSKPQNRHSWVIADPPPDLVLWSAFPLSSDPKGESHGDGHASFSSPFGRRWVDSHAPQRSQHSTSISGSCNEREKTGIWRGNPADTMLGCGNCSHTTDLLWSYSNSVVQVVSCGFNGKRPFSPKMVFMGNRGNKKQGCS